MEAAEDHGEKIMEKALAFGLCAIATEHFFTAFLSSPKASEQFLQPEDVREMFLVATLVSLGFSGFMSYKLKTWYGLVSAIIFILIFFVVYYNSMFPSEVQP